MRWKIEEQAVLMGMMPPHFLSNILWQLKTNQEQKWSKIRKQSDAIGKTDDSGAGRYHMFQYKGFFSDKGTHLSD